MLAIVIVLVVLAVNEKNGCVSKANKLLFLVAACLFVYTAFALFCFTKIR
jgi:hypothetical protein